MKRKILAGLQLLLLAATLAFVGASFAPAEASAGECPIRCFGGAWDCTKPGCYWECT